MVGQHDHERLVQPAARAQRVEQRADAGVGRGHLAQVGVATRALEGGRRREVRGVGVEQVHPQEERLLALQTGEPGARGDDDLRGRALQVAHLGAGWSLGLAVDVEALVEGEGAVERAGGDDGAGRQPPLARQLGQGARRGGQRRDAIVPQRVPRRQEPGQHRGVGGQRQRRHRAGVVVAHALGGQPVEVRGQPRAAAVAAQRVGPRRVEREQDHAPGRRGTSGAAGRGAGPARARRGAERAGLIR